MINIRKVLIWNNVTRKYEESNFVLDSLKVYNDGEIHIFLDIDRKRVKDE